MSEDDNNNTPSKNDNGQPGGQPPSTPTLGQRTSEYESGLDSHESALQAAINNMDPKAVKVLLTNGDMDLKVTWLDPKKYRNALHELTLVYMSYPPLERPYQLNLKFIEILTSLKQNGLDVSDVDIERKNVMHYLAGASGQADTMRVLLANGIKINARDKTGQTPLHIAVTKATFREVEVLLDGGADPNVLDAIGMSAIHLASKRRRNEKILDRLLHSGGLVNLRLLSHNIWGPSPVHIAAKTGCLETLGALMRFKPNLDLTDGSGQTPLHVAASNDITGKIVDRLLQYGAFANARDATFMDTPLHKAVKQNMFDNIQKLLACGRVNPNLGDWLNETALHKAAVCCSDINTLTLLMKAKSNPQAKNHEGHTPLDKAIRAKNVNAVSVIRQYEDMLAQSPRATHRQVPHSPRSNHKQVTQSPRATHRVVSAHAQLQSSEYSIKKLPTMMTTYYH